MLIYIFKWTSRELKNICRPLFYKGLIKELRKWNYFSRWILKDKKIVKEKFMKVYFISDKEEELEKIFKNNDLFEKW